MKKELILSEIFLSNDNVQRDSWNKLFVLVSKYMGYLRRWYLVVNIDMNEIRYFIISNKELPPTIGDLTEFLFEKTKLDLSLKYISDFIYTPKNGSNLIDVYETNELKHNRKLKQVRLKFYLKKESIYHSNTKFIFEDYKKTFFMKSSLTSNPSTLLSINYKDTRFFYKKKPKYLDMQKAMHLLKSDIQNTILKVNTFPYLQGDYYLNQNSYNFDKHSLIIGGSGTGKSKLMSLMIQNISSNFDYRFKYKVIVIDPHASMERDLYNIEKSKIVDFIDSSVDLFSSNTEDIIPNIERMASLFQNLFSDQYNAKIDRLIRYSSYVLFIKKDFSFINLRNLLLDSEYRNNLIKELEKLLPDPVVTFFLVEFNELKTRSYNDSIAPIVSFIDELLLLPVFNIKEKLSNIDSIIEDNFLTVFSLNRNKIGDKATKTISALILNQITNIIESRKIDEHIILMIDEVPILENNLMSKLLSEARKYNLSLFLAGQYFSQISSELKSAVFANTSNYYIFRVSKDDATILENNLSIKLAFDNTLENRINFITNLSDRECLVRLSSGGVLVSTFKAKTNDWVVTDKADIKLKKVAPEPFVSTIKEEKTLFSIESRIKLNDIMIEQSTSRKKVSESDEK